MLSIAALVTGHQRPCKLPLMHMQRLSCHLQSDLHFSAVQKLYLRSADVKVLCADFNLHAWWVRDRNVPRHCQLLFKICSSSLIPFLMLTRQQVTMLHVVRGLLGLASPVNRAAQLAALGCLLDMVMLLRRVNCALMSVNLAAIYLTFLCLKGWLVLTCLSSCATKPGYSCDCVSSAGS